VDDLVVPSGLCRNATDDPVGAVDAAVRLIDHMCEHIGVRDLGGLDVLDFGCGVRFTQAFLNRGVPIKHYVGVDVSHVVIDFLQSNVSDPRFEFFHLDAHNDLYNPTGRPLSGLTVPELERRQFDLICLFSVFTHLAPPDYTAMLKLLRRFVNTDGRLFYTLFINEPTEGGFGYVDRVSAALAAAQHPRMRAGVRSDVGENERVPAFRDDDPTRPLLVALYSRTHAMELIDGTGWRVVDVSPPILDMQHHIVCVPATPAEGASR
jgi:SAM-dependent methyltransferase